MNVRYATGCLPRTTDKASSTVATMANPSATVHGGTFGFLAAFAVMCGFAARRLVPVSKTRGALIKMKAGSYGCRPSKKYRACKGMPPLYARPEFRNFVTSQKKQLERDYTKASQIEKLVKRGLYGKVKLSFASNHFVDEIPWYPHPQSGIKAEVQNQEPDHCMDSPLYVRKYIEPAKFKKLSIPSWEMPHNFEKFVNLQDMVNAGMQYGHAPGQWNQKMLKYLYSEHDGTHIFDLVQTGAMMNRACYWAMEVAARGGKFLWTGTKSQAGKRIKEAALRTKSFYCDKMWVGGILTNQIMVKKGFEKLKTMMQEKSQGKWEAMKTNDQRQAEVDLRFFKAKYGGVMDMNGCPDVLIAVDGVKEKKGINEAEIAGIPVIALLDSNADPHWIDFPVAGNASGTRSIDLFISKLEEAIVRGQAQHSLNPVEEPVEKVFDNWLFSRDRRRDVRRRSKRQHFQKIQWGGYEAWNDAHPWGKIPGVAKFQSFSWQKGEYKFP